MAFVTMGSACLFLIVLAVALCKGVGALLNKIFNPPEDIY